MSRISPFGLFAAAWFAVLALAYRSILSVFPSSKVVDPIEAFFFDTDTTLPALHFALFTLVLIIRRKSLAAALSNPGAPVTGVLVSGVGLAALAWSEFTEQIDLEIDSLVLVLAGTALLLGGRRLLERLVLPLALLWLARPLPPMLTHHLHEWLQRSTGHFAEAVLSPFSAVARSGHLLKFQDRVFEVIEGCSGLRLEITLVTATLVYLAFLSRSRRQTLGVLAFALLLGPLMNGLRVISIMLNPRSEVAQIHSTQGLIFVSLSIVVIAAFDRAVENRLWPGDASETPPGPEVEPESRPRVSPLQSAWVGAIALACLGASFYSFEKAPAKSAPSWGLHEIRPQMGRWKRIRAMNLDRQFWGTVKFGNRLHWEFERENESGLAQVFVVADSRQRRDRSSYSPKTQRRGAAWEITNVVPIRLDRPAVEAERSVQLSGDQRWLSLHYRIGERGLLEASARWLLALDLRPGVAPPDLVTVRIDVRIDDRNPAAALAQLAELQSEVGAALERAAPR